MSDEVVGPGSERIGDAERMSALDELSRHFAEGRLDSTEFDERSAGVTRARTRAELEPLFTDLPARAEAGVVAERDHSRLARTLYAVTPPVATVAFFLLMAAHVQYAWLAFLAVPIVFAIVRGITDIER